MNAQAAERSPGFAKHPAYRVVFEPCAKRVRGMVGGETVVDSTAVQILYESKHLPVYYFPMDDVRQDLIRPTDHSTFCPFKGHASYWTLEAGGEIRENAIWGYPTPFAEVPDFSNLVAFYWNKVDRWFEEDEEVFVHPRDPHVRVDILDSSRQVEVFVAGQSVAKSNRARFLFETGLPVRYYLPKEDVNAVLLDSDTRTACPYKGDADYHSLQLGDEVLEDLVWVYRDPVHEAARIKDYVCFFNERVDRIEIDGRPEEKPNTKWSP